MKNYKQMIGDGKTPNKYWVFQYDQKYQRNHDGELEIIKEAEERNDSLLGEFDTFSEALSCVNYKAYLPNVIIEDRLSGQIFEQICIVCPCCGHEEHQSLTDINFTKEKLKELGIEFK